MNLQKNNFPLSFFNQSCVTRLHQFAIAFVCMLCTIAVRAQNEIVNQSDVYYTDGKIQMGKGSDYKEEVKNGKLYIKFKGKQGRLSQSLYNRVSPDQECYDLESKFELKFIEGNDKAAFGMEFYTYDQKRTTNYINITKFMLTGDGKLKFYSGPDEKMEIYNQPSEPCPSFKPGEINFIQIIRKQKDWYLVINKDTVRHSTETSLYPVIKMLTGNFISEGKLEVEMDNYSYVVRPDMKEVQERMKKLNALSGSYLTYSSCLKNDSKRFIIKLKYEGDGSAKFTLTGLSRDAVTVYLNETGNNLFTTDQNFYIARGGENYEIRRFKIKQDESGAAAANVTFNAFSANTDCDFDGDKKP